MIHPRIQEWVELWDGEPSFRLTDDNMEDVRQWLRETTAKLQKLEWIENEEEINTYIHEKVSSYREFEGTYPSWCKHEDWYEEEEEE